MSVEPDEAQQLPSGVRPEISHRQGSLLVLIAALVVSFGGLVFRSTDDISAWGYLFFRGVGVVAATGLILGFRYRGNVGEAMARTAPVHISAGIILGVVNCLFIAALSITTVAFVLLFQSLAPLTSAYFSWLMLRERVNPRVAIATIISLVGVMVMVSGTIGAAISPWALVAALIPLGFGWYATTIRSAEEIDPSIPVIVAGFTMMAIGGLVVLATTRFGMSEASLSLRDALLGIFAGAVVLGLPLALFNIGQRVVPSPETSLLLTVEVLLGPVWVWFFMNENPTLTTLIGGAIILAAVTLLLSVRSR